MDLENRYAETRVAPPVSEAMMGDAIRVILGYSRDLADALVIIEALGITAEDLEATRSLRLAAG